MANEMEVHWILRHGAPNRFSADNEFTRGRMKSFLESHDIQLVERPVRPHNKTGIVERKNKTLKLIFERLQQDLTHASDSVLLARATFLSNSFSGSSAMSAFELVRGYSPAILGAEPRLVSPELLEAYKDQQCMRALQRLINSRDPRSIQPESLLRYTPIFYFYNST